MRLRIGLALALSLIAAAATSETNWAAAGKAWWAHIQFLADDKLEGRNVGSKGYEAAADYVVGQFEKAGLASGAGSTYSQPVGFIKATLDEPRSRLSLVRDGNAIPVTLGDEAMLGSSSRTSDVQAPLVFAGYGLNIPEAGFNDLTDPNVRGAVAVLFAGRTVPYPGQPSLPLFFARRTGQGDEDGWCGGYDQYPESANHGYTVGTPEREPLAGSHVTCRSDLRGGGRSFLRHVESSKSGPTLSRLWPHDCRDSGRRGS